MKRAHEDHVGMKIKMLSGEYGKVVKVSEDGYRVKINGEKIDLPLEEIRWTKNNKLFQMEVVAEAEEDLTGTICQLQNCGTKVDGVIVKVSGKTEDTYRFQYATECGGEAPHRCVVPLTKDSNFDKSWELKLMEDGRMLCNCCGKAHKQKDLLLYYVPLKEWHKQGVICKDCEKSVRPILNLVKRRPADDDAPLKVGASLITKFGTPELTELNTAAVTTALELAERHGLKIEESHKQIRPTAMEYTLTFKLPHDEVPKPVPVKKLSAPPKVKPGQKKVKK